MLKLETPLSVAALTLVSPAPLPVKEAAVIFPRKLFAAAPSSGTTDGSMATIPLVVIGFGLPTRPSPAVTLVTVPLPPVPPETGCPFTTRAEKLPVPCTSSAYCGVVVPMPTLVPAAALLSPAIEPSTSALLAPTTEFEPIAVALLIPPVAASDPAPRKVLLLVVSGELSPVCPANTPSAVL